MARVGGGRGGLRAWAKITPPMIPPCNTKDTPTTQTKPRLAALRAAPAGIWATGKVLSIGLASPQGDFSAWGASRGSVTIPSFSTPARFTVAITSTTKPYSNFRSACR